MRFAYLHGYQGSVSEEKKEYLDILGECYKPLIDYDNEPDIIDQLVQKFKNDPIDFISGTSLGGMISYYLGLMLEIPVLMFNPAVIAIDRLRPYISEKLMNSIPVQPNFIFTGMKDDVIEPRLQIKFAEGLKNKKANITQVFDEEMTHLVTLKEFKKSFETFLKSKESRCL